MKKIIQNIFKKSDDVSQPVNSNQQLTRSDDFLKDFAGWKNSQESTAMLGRMYQTFLQKENRDPDIDLNVHNSPGADAVSISRIDKNNPMLFRFLLDLFREKILSLNYRMYSSTVEKKKAAGDMLIFERHYLKPDVLNQGKPYEQYFGNILLELEFINNKVRYLKILSTYYTGYDYKPAMQFDDLIVRIFSV